jgi:hypothetical protein
MLANSARYTTKNVESLPEKGKMWEAGCAYLTAARDILSELYDISTGKHHERWLVPDKIVHQSRPTTCQALLILGHREFGIGQSDAYLALPQMSYIDIHRIHGAGLAVYRYEATRAKIVCFGF